jgi:hypothetical protein
MLRRWITIRRTKTQRSNLHAVISDGLIGSLSLILLCLGIAKMLGVIYPADDQQAYLQLPNPIFQIVSNRVVLFGAAACEMCVGMYGLRFDKSPRSRAGLMLWIASATLMYKVSLVFVGYNGPCGCLVGLTRLIPLNPGRQRWIADIIIAATLVISISILASGFLLRNGITKLPKDRKV